MANFDIFSLITLRKASIVHHPVLKSNWRLIVVTSKKEINSHEKYIAISCRLEGLYCILWNMNNFVECSERNLNEQTKNSTVDRHFPIKTSQEIEMNNWQIVYYLILNNNYHSRVSSTWREEEKIVVALGRRRGG